MPGFFPHGVVFGSEPKSEGRFQVNMANVDRSVPLWAASTVAALSRDRPAVVTTEIIGEYLREAGSDRDAARVASDLQQLGWLSTLHVKGAWAFVPAGAERPSDPYLDLRGWQARDRDAVFALAGEAACWHLGYLPRRYLGTVAVWLPKGQRVAHGLRSQVSIVRIGWDTTEVGGLGPTSKLLRAKRLDLTAWASGLPALGPDAVLVQLAVRPSSFRVWADLVGQLQTLADDCDPTIVAALLADESASAWQRAAYLLDRGGRHHDALGLLADGSSGSMPAAQLGVGTEAIWSNEFHVNDHIVAPLQRQLGKA